MCYKIKYPGNITLLRFNNKFKEGIMNLDKSHKCMGFMMKYFINMEIQMYGIIVLMFLVFF